MILFPARCNPGKSTTAIRRAASAAPRRRWPQAPRRAEVITNRDSGVFPHPATRRWARRRRNQRTRGRRTHPHPRSRKRLRPAHRRRPARRHHRARIWRTLAYRPPSPTAVVRHPAPTDPADAAAELLPTGEMVARVARAVRLLGRQVRGPAPGHADDGALGSRARTSQATCRSPGSLPGAAPRDRRASGMRLWEAPSRHIGSLPPTCTSTSISSTSIRRSRVRFSIAATIRSTGGRRYLIRARRRPANRGRPGRGGCAKTRNTRGRRAGQPAVGYLVAGNRKTRWRSLPHHGFYESPGCGMR